MRKIDYKALFFYVLSRWYFPLLGLVIGWGAARLYLRYQENVYTVSATLQFKAQASSKTLGGLELFTRPTNMSDEIHLIRSHDMISRVIANLDFDVSYYHKGDIRVTEFYKNAPFKVVLDSSSFQIAGRPFFITILGPNEYRLEADLSSGTVVDIKNKTNEGVSAPEKINKVFRFGEPLKMANLSFTIYLQQPNYNKTEGSLYFMINRHDLLTNSYKNKLAISPVSRGSSILRLSMSGPLVQKNIDFLNMLNEVCIQEGLNEKNRIATNTIAFIDEQLRRVSDSLRTAERQIENFRSKYNYQESSRGMESVIARLEDLENEKASLQMKTEYYTYVLQYMRDNKDMKEIVAPSSIGIEDAILSNLINELIKLKSERAVLIQGTSEKNPYIRELDRKIGTTTETLHENVANILKVSDIPIRNINDRIRQLEKSLSGMPEQDRLWLDIQRKFNLNNHLYNFLLEKRAEAGITKASSSPDHAVVEKASWLNAYQIAPNSSGIYNMAMLLGFALPAGIIALIYLLNDRIKSKEDLLSMVDLPLLGVVGHKMMMSNLVVMERPKSAIAEAFRSIRVNLSYLASENSSKLVVVTSSISGEGKTFFSTNLANVIAISNKRTLLIGADLRKPKIFSDLGLENTEGLSLFLAGKAGIEDIINKTSIDNFDIIAAGPVPPNPAELLAGKRMDGLLAELKTRYDYIIVDTPPVGLVADGLHVMSQADITIYLVRHNYTRYKMLDKVIGLHRDGNVRNLNLVMNDMDFEAAGRYGYGGGYGYYSGYGYYDEDGRSTSSWYSEISRKVFSKK